MSFRIEPVRNAADLDRVRGLFREYAEGLGIDLAFQGFEEELARLPGKYARPGGDLLLAWDEGGAALGCVGLRPLDRAGACELKRLYVRLAARGAGLGRALATAIIDRATATGYCEIVLDTLPWLSSAIALYSALGFEPIPPYSQNALPGTLYFHRRLRTG
ncbi:MAG: GNAT family N-acetyltransferase [Stellaceae bacterium]